MADDQDGIRSLLKNRPIAIILFTASAASIVVAIYHLVSVCFCNRRASLRRLSAARVQTPRSADRILAAELIASHKYRKGENDTAAEDCAVCLAEFEEGEELRALPGCEHAFHAACIDMWLFSHETCPICRADATPSPRVCRPLASETVS